VMVLGLTDRSFPAGLSTTEQDAKAAEAHTYLRSLAHSLCTCAVGNCQEGQVALAVELETPVDEYYTRTWSSDLGRRLRDRVKDQTGVRYRVGIGRPVSAMADLARSYQEAQAAFRFEDVSEKVTHFGDREGQATEPEPEAPGLADEPRLPPRWRPTPAVLLAVAKGKQYIRDHFAEEITLERAAREVSLTPYYFSKIFSRVAGECLVDYLTRVRVEQAKRLLTDPAVSIKEASFAVGYNDPNYFSRVFKKVTGQTPTEYRTKR
jgi:two-component system, response regulator YesN